MTDRLDMAGALLREKGLHLSQPRQLLLALMLEHGGHHTADDLYALLSQQAPNISRTTVYNILDALCQADIVRTLPMNQKSMWYELNGTAHAHFCCDGCGRITDLGDIKGLDTFNGLDGCQIRQRDVIYRGLCPACQGA